MKNKGSVTNMYTEKISLPRSNVGRVLPHPNMPSSMAGRGELAGRGHQVEDVSYQIEENISHQVEEGTLEGEYTSHQVMPHCLCDSDCHNNSCYNGYNELFNNHTDAPTKEQLQVVWPGP